VLALGRPAQADDLSQLEGMLEQPLVSTVSLAAEDESVAPATSSTITAEDLRRHGIRSLDEAINFLSLGMMTQNPLRSAEVGARGVLFTGDFNDHILLLLDGHALNEAWSGTTTFDRSSGIPIELIDHIEVVLGPGSVLYGSYAMLGVINVVTRRAREFNGFHAIVDVEGGKMRDGVQGGLVGAGGAELTSGRLAIGGGHEFTILGRTLELSGQVQYYSQKGPAFLFGPQPVTDATTGAPKLFGGQTTPGIWGGRSRNSYGTDAPSLYLRAASGDLEAFVRLAGVDRRTPYLTPVNNIFGIFDDHYSVEQERWGSVYLRHHARLSTWISLDSRVYGDTYSYKTQRRSPAPGDCGGDGASGCSFVNTGGSRWAGVEERVVIEWSRTGSVVTTAGVDGRLRSVAPTHYETTFDDGSPSTVTEPHPRYLDPTLGAYLQQTASPARWLHANLGARADIDSRYGRALSPRAALSVSPWAGGTIKGIFASAFRVPSTYEATYTETSDPAHPLHPESERSFEGSFEQRFGSHKLLFGGFHTDWNDLIYYRYDLYYSTGVGYYDNSGVIESTGFQAAYEGVWLDRRLRAGVNVTGAHVRRTLPDGTSQLLPASPAYFGNARLTYELPAPAPTIGLATHWAGAALADQGATGQFTPAPFAPARIVGRVSLSGALPGGSRLSYRLTAQLTSASRVPYVVGPNQSTSPAQPGAELAPVDQARFGLALQYDLE
jgi:outer membrane receptor protein involved in Fe transport